MFLSILLQANAALADSTSTAGGEAAPIEDINVLSMLMKGGPIMIPIALCSLIAVYIMVERYFNIKKKFKINQNFMSSIKDNVVNGNIPSALNLCRTNPTPVSRMVEKGLMRIGKPLKDIEASMENVGNLEISKAEKNLGILGIIAGIAPMLGFIGTILGVIKIFHDISITDNFSISTIAGGLYQKMITSLAGLVVGVFAYSGYHMLMLMVDRLTFRIEAAVIEFVDILQEPTR
ncbi:MAG: MotA/TolQ/ExbB proton channel family protein [Bacteroidia bacterium]